MCEPVTLGLAAVSAGLAIYSAVSSADAKSDAASAEEAAAARNQQLAERAAQDALARGEQDAAKVQMQGEQVKGAQRAGFAGQGVVVDEGSAGRTVADTVSLTALDKETVRANAAREAWGLRTQGIQYLEAGKRSADALRASATSDIIGGTGAAVGALGSGLAASGAFKSAPKPPSGGWV